MRSLLIVAPALLLSAAAGAQDLPATLVQPHCKPGADKAAAPRVGSPRKLGEMPPAKEYKAVWRTDAKGCPAPIVVREGLGQEQR